ncbi:DUF3783 domain-containing protein [Treponema sp. OttesenSCG-928-L16]|nr:DUF3783 domain-containing protein [Treponema sp. OttesenSCG-928-L16]
MNEPVIFLHGFSREQLIAVMRAAKKAAAEAGMEPSSIAFASSTPNNLGWTVKDLIREVREEHEYMQNNPPPPGAAG